MEKEGLRLKIKEIRKTKKYKDIIYNIMTGIRIISPFFVGYFGGQIYFDSSKHPEELAKDIIIAVIAAVAFGVSAKKTLDYEKENYPFFFTKDNKQKDTINNGIVIKNPLPPKSRSSK